MQSAQLLEVESQLEALGLMVMAQHLEACAQTALGKKASYVEFLHSLLADELTTRQDRWMTTRVKLAGFPYRKTLADFDFAFQPAVDERTIRDLATLSFIGRHDNVILLGPPGVGKTHLGIALGMEAIRQRIGVYFTTAHALVSDLRAAAQQGTFAQRLRVYTKPGLLVLDELTYAPFDAKDASHFFRLVSERYEHGSIILTANRTYGEWGAVFNDAVLATAILDRLLHHSVTVNIKSGQSYRLRDKVRAGVLDSRAVET